MKSGAEEPVREVRIWTKSRTKWDALCCDTPCSGAAIRGKSTCYTPAECTPNGTQHLHAASRIAGPGCVLCAVLRNRTNNEKERETGSKPIPLRIVRECRFSNLLTLAVFLSLFLFKTFLFNLFRLHSNSQMAAEDSQFWVRTSNGYHLMLAKWLSHSRYRFAAPGTLVIARIQ